LEQLTSAQLSEWEAYDRLDPIGSWRIDHGFAQVVSEITNIVNQLYPKEGTKPVVTSPIDYMPIWDKVERQKTIKQRELKESKKQTASEIKNYLMSFANAHNKRLLKQNIPPREKRIS